MIFEIKPNYHLLSPRKHAKISLQNVLEKPQKKQQKA